MSALRKLDDEREYLETAYHALNGFDVQKRLREIEHALKFDPDPTERRALRREFLDLTDHLEASNG